MMRPIAKFLLPAGIGIFVICTLVCGLVHIGSVDTVFAVPLVLFLPGFFLLISIDPTLEKSESTEWILWTVGASLGLAVVGGFLLNYLGGIDRKSFFVYFIAVSFIELCIAVFRVANLPADRVGDFTKADASNESLFMEMLDGLHDTSDQTGRESAQQVVHRRRRYVSVGVMLVAAIMIVVAIMISEWSQSTSLSEEFVQFWIIPASHGAAPTDNAVQVGIQNSEGIAERYVVVVVAYSNVTIGRWHVYLAPGQTWTKVLAVRGRTSVDATLAPQSDPSRVSRSVHLELTS